MKRDTHNLDPAGVGRPEAPPRPRFSAWRAPWMTFYSLAFYRDVARRRRGLGLLYLLLLLAICWAAYAVRVQILLTRFVDGEGAQWIEQVPRITIAKGVAHVKAAQPHYIRNPRTGRVFAILDTSGKVTDLDETPAWLLLTRTRLIIRLSPWEQRLRNLEGLRDFEIDALLLRSLLDTLKRWLAPSLYPIALGLSFVFHAAQLVVYAALGLALARCLGAPLRFPALMRLSAAAVTPPILLDTLMDLIGLELPYCWAACLVIAMAYVVFGVTAAAGVGSPASGAEG